MLVKLFTLVLSPIARLVARCRPVLKTRILERAVLVLRLKPVRLDLHCT